ncbi:MULTISPECIES: iron ABC transporter permease [unclassified Pseudofrankia]|uniref:ABC transporter permease n=1 Tax=unclassified Pseudofrankia TaxID=2994372 RepID=UPI0008DA9B99|nr:MULTISPECIES: iron ABC transporter permease [unclassified Pseudofrankia]MDT3444397.1 iron ABC transporter permease [Pseudofrankia sp. BMG5.37]OHV56473.1 transporter [Pseudofrankia sp. BMG5.36]
MATLALPGRRALAVDHRAVGRFTMATALVAVLAYLVLAPLIRLQLKAFTGPGGNSYHAAFARDGFGRTLLYTVGLALGSLLIALVLGTWLAWASTRLPRRLRFLSVFPVLPIVVPAIALVVGWAFLLAPGPGYLNAVLRKLPWWSGDTTGPINIYSLPWIVIITGFSLTSFVYLFVRAAFANIGADFLEAAQVCGSPGYQVFFRVTLPLLRPALTYGGGVALLLGLGQLTGPLLLGTNEGITVLTTDMYNQVSSTPVDYGLAAAIGSPLLGFGLLVVLGQKFLLGDQRRFVTHGGKGFRSSARPSKIAAVGIVLFSLTATVLPLIGLLIVSLSRYWTKNVRPSTFTLDNFRKVLEASATRDAIQNSVVYSLIAVLIVLPIGFAAASILLRGRRYPVLAPILDFLVTLPLGVPAVLFGVGFLVTYSQKPFVLYGTRWVMILVYVTLMLPFATRMQLSGLIALGDSYEEASRVSGAGPVRTKLRVILPLMRSSLGGAAALMFVLLTQEFTASVLVRSLHTQVMGTVLFDSWGSGFFPLVAAVALIMSAVTAVGVAVALVAGGSDSLNAL